MSPTADKPLVLVFGATGNTGKSIVQGLLDSRNFRVAAAVRPTSLSKPEVEAFRKDGVEIRVGDMKDDAEKLKQLLDGVSILISAVLGFTDQKAVFHAAKEAGVQRVVPSEFSIPSAGSIRTVDKEEVRAYIKSLDLPYTIIDVGWWMQTFLPLPTRSAVSAPFRTMSETVPEPGDARVLLTDLNHIGAFVARIIGDPRTLNRSVIIWEEERQIRAAREVGETMSGEAEALRTRMRPLALEDLPARKAAAEAALAKDPKDLQAFMNMSMCAFMQSICVIGEGTLDFAKGMGYLDARELYPDIPVASLEEFAEEFYKLPEPGYVYHWAGSVVTSHRLTK